MKKSKNKDDLKLTFGVLIFVIFNFLAEYVSKYFWVLSAVVFVFLIFQFYKKWANS